MNSLFPPSLQLSPSSSSSPSFLHLSLSVVILASLSIFRALAPSNAAPHPLSGLYHYAHLSITSTPLTSWCSCVRRWSPRTRPRGGFPSSPPRRSAGSALDPTSRTATFRESPATDSRDRNQTVFKRPRKWNRTLAPEQQETWNSLTCSSDLIVKIHPALNTGVNSSWDPPWKIHEPLLPSGSRKEIFKHTALCECTVLHWESQFKKKKEKKKDIY